MELCNHWDSRCECWGGCCYIREDIELEVLSAYSYYPTVDVSRRNTLLLQSLIIKESYKVMLACFYKNYYTKINSLNCSLNDTIYYFINLWMELLPDFLMKEIYTETDNSIKDSSLLI